MLFQWWDLLGISCISDVLLTILPKVFSSHLIPQWLGVAKYHKSHRCAKNLWCWVQSLGENKLWLGRFLTCFNENFYKVFSQTYQFNIVCWQVLFLFFFCPRILLLEMLITFDILQPCEMSALFVRICDWESKQPFIKKENTEFSEICKKGYSGISHDAWRPWRPAKSS